MQEIVSGYPIRPEPFGVGWFTVGILEDESIYECRVHFIIIVPGHDLLRTKPLRASLELPNPPKRSRWYFSRSTNQWELDLDCSEDEDSATAILDLLDDGDVPDGKDHPTFRAG